MGKINKFQYGYKVPTRTWGDIGNLLNKGAEFALKVFEPVGKAVSSVVSNLPAGGASAVLPLLSPKNFLLSKLRLKIFEEKVGPALSPTNHAIAWTLGSLNPKVGLLKLAEWGPAALLGSFVTDAAALKYVPKVPRAVSRTKAGKSYLISKEIDKATNKGIRLAPAKTNWNNYEDFRQNGLTGLQILERSWLDRELESGDPNTMVHYDFGDHRSSFRGNNGAYILNNLLVPGLSSKGQTNYIWWGNKGPWLNAQWMFINPKLQTPTRYISAPRTKLFLKVNDHPEKTIGLNLVAPLTIMDNEFVTEGPVDLSNASIIQRSPFGWWERVKTVKNIPLKETHPWELSNSKYSRFLQSNGKIRLQLPSHTEAKPRQFILEPKGDNKYYVHMRVWDDVDKKVPATMSSAEKNTLFEALYNELPDGTEILFPESGPGNYGTRGTVAGLLHLSRDKRFTPGTPGTLLYLDKDGKTVRTYNGTSFIKKPYTDERYSREPVIMGDEWGAWEVDYPDYVRHRVNKVKLQVEGSNGKVYGHDYDAMPGSIVLQHMQKQGFHPYYVLHPGANLRGQLAETTRRLDNIAGIDWVRNKQMYLDGTAPYYLGYFDEAGLSGSHNVKNGINLIEPNPHSKMHLDMMHEGISHGTDNYMPLTVIDNYQSFVDKVMNHPDINPDKTIYKYKGWSESIPSGTDKWYELRATMGEIRKNMYDNIAKNKGVKVNESTIESLRPEFERLVDAMTLDLAAETLRKANPYGRVYGTLGPTINPSFLGEFKGLLKYAPVTTPFIFNKLK